MWTDNCVAPSNAGYQSSFPHHLHGMAGPHMLNGLLSTIGGGTEAEQQLCGPFQPGLQLTLLYVEGTKRE